MERRKTKHKIAARVLDLETDSIVKFESDKGHCGSCLDDQEYNEVFEDDDCCCLHRQEYEERKKKMAETGALVDDQKN